MASQPTFDPNGVGVKGSFFGLPYDTEQARIVVIPMPWDVTVSYGAGAAEGAKAIWEASPQIDYAQWDMEAAWKLPLAMAEIPEVWHAKGQALRKHAAQYIGWLEEGSPEPESTRMQAILNEVNAQCAQLMTYVEQECAYWHGEGKQTILLGGDHSTPLGHMKTLAAKHEAFGILQIDAHADLRAAYEGFEFSHASIMYNALKLPEVTQLVQVGIRDFCEEEKSLIEASKGRISTYYDAALKEGQYQGVTWASQCERIISELPQKVYVSFDIDGLDPKLCPHTGTPVPGGFELDEVMYLVKQVVASGRQIIGADLCEVAPGPDEWDGNVGARALYRMALLMAQSQGLA